MIGLALYLITLWDYSYDVTAQCAYDNNVYSYSVEHINDFLDQTRAYRFPFETYDDAVTSTDFNLYLRNKFIAQKTTTFNVLIDHRQYIINSQKNYQKIGCGIRQSMGKLALKTSYLWIPSYLIRYYRTPGGNPTDYEGCDVAYHTVSGKASLFIRKNLTLHISYSRKWDNYEKTFSLYDAKSHIANVKARFDLSDRVGFEIVYEFRDSKTDTAGVESTPDDEVPDGSFKQQTINGVVIAKLKCIFPSTITCGYQYGFRNYGTQFASDVMHYGRQDHMHKFVLEGVFRIITGMNLVLSYQRQWRNATSEVFPEIDDIKDYSKYKLSGGLNFYH